MFLTFFQQNAVTPLPIRPLFQIENLRGHWLQTCSKRDCFPCYLSKGSHGPMSSDLYLLNSMLPTFLAMTPSGRRYPTLGDSVGSHFPGRNAKVDVVVLHSKCPRFWGRAPLLLRSRIQSASSVLSERANGPRDGFNCSFYRKLDAWSLGERMEYGNCQCNRLSWLALVK